MNRNPTHCAWVLNSDELMETEHPHYHALIQTIATLRAPGGCPWDQEQTHSSLTECLIEECSELLEAIDRLDYEHMVEELGDVLLNVAMQAEIAREAGHFDMETVCKQVNEKLIRRHPHVFERDADSLEDSQQVLKRWEEIKATEVKNGPQAAEDSPFKPQPPRLPALLFAKKTFKQLSKAGFQNHPTLPHETMNSLRSASESELAATLFSVAAVCRERGLDPELLCRQYTQQIRDALQ